MRREPRVHAHELPALVRHVHARQQPGRGTAMPKLEPRSRLRVLEHHGRVRRQRRLHEDGLRALVRRVHGQGGALGRPRRRRRLKDSCKRTGPWVRLVVRPLRRAPASKQQRVHSLWHDRAAPRKRGAGCGADHRLLLSRGELPEPKCRRRTRRPMTRALVTRVCVRYPVVVFDRLCI